MPDVVVTVPKAIWEDWIAEGDAAGDPESGEEWGFYTGGGTPRIEPGERVYVVAHGRLRGYAPLTRLARAGPRVVFCRKGGAVAVTIAPPIRGFQGWQYRWWDRKIEIPFPDWKTADVPVKEAR
jgi:hypothetical protein